jgi:hypothetical protein
MIFKVDLMPPAARYLRSDDLIELDGSFAEIETSICANGSMSRLSFHTRDDHDTILAVRVRRARDLALQFPI